jgi:transcriptional regulator
MLVHRWDAPLDDHEWLTFLAVQGFGHLVASGRDRDVPVIVPTQFVLDGTDVVLHLARPNPIWAAIAENPMVVLSVAGDWAYVPAGWKAVGDEDPRRGIPTTYYGAVQLTAAAEVIDEPEMVAAVLRRQLATLEPGTDLVDPVEHGARLGQIRGLRLAPTEVRAKFKYGGNVDSEHRRAVADHLAERDGPGDRAARDHLLRRLDRT